MKGINKEQQDRLRSLLKKYLIVLVIGLGYYLFIKITSLAIPCVFYLITNKYCPGCGITRMLMSLLRFDFTAAAGYNLFVLCLLPFGVFLLIYKSVLYVKTGKTNNSLPENIFYILAFVLCVVFFILRNTERFAFLAP